MGEIGTSAIWDCIKNLLYQHNCVIVPDWGGFVCSVEPARIDQVSHLITPPAKRIMFNQNLKSNDGLLANKLAANNNISYNQALQFINDAVNHIKQQLNDSKQLDIAAFGSFRLNAEANYVFLPDKFNNYLYGSFGLQPLQSNPISEATRGVNKSRIFKDRKDVKTSTNKSRVRGIGFKIITSLVIIAVAFNAYIFIDKSGLNTNYNLSTTGIHSWFDSLVAKDNQPTTVEKQVPVEQASENTQPIVETTIDSTLNNEVIAPEFTILNIAETFASTSKQSPVFGQYEFNEDGSLIVKTDLEVIEPSPITEIVEPSISPVVTREHNTTATYSYYVIGGVFCKEGNARNFLSALKNKGFSASLILNKRINCNRVAYKKLNQLSDALALMDSIKATENPEAWILKIAE